MAELGAFCGTRNFGPIQTAGANAGGNFWDGRVPDLTLPLWEGIRPSSFRSSRTGRILRYSSRCTAWTPSKSIPRSRSTNSSVRHSLHTNPRERSARSVRSTMHPNMGRPQEPIHALHIRGTREAIVLRPGAMFCVPLLRGSTRHSSHHARERHPHHVLLCEYRCSEKSGESLLPADRQGIQSSWV
jgi:hypothetical protein